MYNGEQAGGIVVTAGILQGCPLSGTVLALAVDPLVRAYAPIMVLSGTRLCVFSPIRPFLGALDARAVAPRKFQERTSASSPRRTTSTTWCGGRAARLGLFGEAQVGVRLRSTLECVQVWASRPRGRSGRRSPLRSRSGLRMCARRRMGSGRGCACTPCTMATWRRCYCTEGASPRLGPCSPGPRDGTLDGDPAGRIGLRQGVAQTQKIATISEKCDEAAVSP